MQQNKTSKTKAKPRRSKRYTTAQKEAFKLLSRYAAEDRAEAQALRDKLEWEAFLEWQERNKGRILKAPAAPPPVLVLDLPPIAALTPSVPRAVPAPAHQAPALPVLPVLNFTPEDIAAIHEAARELREVSA